MAEFKNTTIDDTGFLELPSGTSAQRPSNPQAGMIRYNTDDEIVEVYNGTEWGPLVEIPIDAEGGSISDVTIGGEDYRIHAFTSTGTSTFTVNSIGTSDGEIDYLIVGGGAGGASRHGGGGGAGGLITGTFNIAVSTYSVTVGNGGNGAPSGSSAIGNNGQDSTLFGFTALGGGYGSSDQTGGGDGGSGGGSRGSPGGPGGTGLQPTSADGGFGNDGGQGSDNDYDTGGGGGGAGAPGAEGVESDLGGGTAEGGDGLDQSNLFTTAFGENGFFAGGGGGGGSKISPRSGGIGGGGAGGGENGGSTPGQANTGGGGGAGGHGDGNQPGEDGGSGIVLIRYRI